MLMIELQRIITIHKLSQLLIYYNRWIITAVALLYYGNYIYLIIFTI